jgi:glycosyltransferase involved in cell wall biosynthesis
VHPRLANQEIAEGLAKAKVFFFPTQYEGFGMALSEAMACGCAPVTTPTGFGATLRNGEEALICDFTDTDAMERAVLSLLHNDEWRARIGRNAWERVRGLTWETNIAKLEAIYTQWSAEHRAFRTTASVSGNNAIAARNS